MASHKSDVHVASFEGKCSFLWAPLTETLGFEAKCVRKICFSRSRHHHANPSTSSFLMGKGWHGAASHRFPSDMLDPESCGQAHVGSPSSAILGKDNFGRKKECHVESWAELLFQIAIQQLVERQSMSIYVYIYIYDFPFAVVAGRQVMTLIAKHCCSVWTRSRLTLWMQQEG